MKRIIYFACLILLLPELSAKAYVDPGAGSVLLQLILGGAAGLALIFKLYWNRIRNLFQKKTQDKIDVKEEK